VPKTDRSRSQCLCISGPFLPHGSEVGIEPRSQRDSFMGSRAEWPLADKAHYGISRGDVTLPIPRPYRSLRSAVVSHSRHIVPP
jgi:hypothetical protein